MVPEGLAFYEEFAHGTHQAETYFVKGLIRRGQLPCDRHERGLRQVLRLRLLRRLAWSR